jgi:hypothetical protein
MREAAAFVLYLLAVHGLANAIAFLKVGRWIFGTGYCEKEECSAPGHPKEGRRFLARIPHLGDLFFCPPCLSFWIGIVFSRLAFSPLLLLVPLSIPWWKAAVLDGLAASAFSFFAHIAAQRTIFGATPGEKAQNTVLKI